MLSLLLNGSCFNLISYRLLSKMEEPSVLQNNLFYALLDIFYLQLTANCVYMSNILIVEDILILLA